MANVKISALPAATSVADADLIPIVQGGATKKVAASLVRGGVAVSHIKVLPESPQANTVYNVVAFYEGWAALSVPPSSGGGFAYNPSLSKINHNGGTIIAPEAIAAWDGTQAGLSTLLNWTGSGSGCWVKLVGSKPVSPIEFGAVSGTGTDSTLALSKCIQHADTFIGKSNVFRITSRVTVPNGRFISGDRTATVRMDGTGFNGTSTLYASNSLGFLITGATSGGMSGFSIELFNQSDELVAGAIAVRSSSNIDITEMELYGFRKSKIIAIDSCTKCNISNNKIRNSLLASATNGQLTGIDVDNNRVSGVASKELIIQHNHIFDLACSPAFLAAYGDQTDGVNISHDDSGNHVIDNNIIFDVGEGIDCFGNNCSIRNNYIVNAYGFGIKLIHGARRNMVSDNRIEEPGLAGISLTGSNADANHTEYNVITNNVISGVNAKGFWNASATAGIRVDNDNGSKYARYNTIKNNNIILGSNMKYGVLLDTGSQYNRAEQNLVDTFITSEIANSGTNNAVLKGAWYVPETSWTPTFKGTTTTGEFTYSEQAGRVLRVGNMVTVWGRLTVSGITTAAAGELDIGGIPVTSAGGGGLLYSAAIAQYDKIPINTADGFTSLTARLLNNSTRLSLIQCGNNVNQQPINAASVAVGTVFVFSCTYLSA